MARNKLCKHSFLVHNFATASQPNDSTNVILSCGVVFADMQGTASSLQLNQEKVLL